MYHFLKHGGIYYHKAILIAYNLKHLYLNFRVAGKWIPFFPLAKFEEMDMVAAKPMCVYRNSVKLTRFSCVLLILSASPLCTLLCIYQFINGHSKLRKQICIR